MLEVADINSGTAQGLMSVLQRAKKVLSAIQELLKTISTDSIAIIGQLEWRVRLSLSFLFNARS